MTSTKTSPMQKIWKNKRIALSMLPLSVRQQFLTITDEESGAWLLIGPYQICLNIPMYTTLARKTARGVREIYHTTIRECDYEYSTYVPKYENVESLKTLRFFKPITDADITDTSANTLAAYLPTVNVLVYLNQHCEICKHYITDVGIDDNTVQTVTQCINCGHIALDTIKPFTRRWVRNYTGTGQGTYTDD